MNPETHSLTRGEEALAESYSRLQLANGVLASNDFVRKRSCQ